MSLEKLLSVCCTFWLVRLPVWILEMSFGMDLQLLERFPSSEYRTKPIVLWNWKINCSKHPEHLRICPHCTLDSVEDEMKCTFYFTACYMTISEVVFHKINEHNTVEPLSNIVLGTSNNILQAGFLKRNRFP